MAFRFSDTHNLYKVTDTSSGIEIIEKYSRERVMARLGDADVSWPGFVFVFHDPSAGNKNNECDTEFFARVLRREVEMKDSQGKTVKYRQVYGFDIDIDEFHEAFADYLKGAEDRQSLETTIRDALYAMYGSTLREFEVNLKKGVNCPRRKYVLRHGHLSSTSK